jgi:hypothetical protein
MATSDQSSRRELASCRIESGGVLKGAPVGFREPKLAV